MPSKIKTGKINSRQQLIKVELTAWAKLSLETKFIVSLVLLVLAFILSGFVPILSSVFNVWGVIIFFEAIFQGRFKSQKKDEREIFNTFLYAGLIGWLAGSFLLLYFDLNYFIYLSLLAFLTRYIWFLLPLSKIIPFLRHRS